VVRGGRFGFTQPGVPGTTRPAGGHLGFQSADPLDESLTLRAQPRVLGVQLVPLGNQPFDDPVQLGPARNPLRHRSTITDLSRSRRAGRPQNPSTRL
jgi:hypothetical protein